MKKLLLTMVLFFGLVAIAAPWCAVPNYGTNKACYYYSYSSCMNAVNNSGGMYVMCVANY